MDLPDCPPGAEGYHDSVTEKPKKPLEDSCTKAEQEFQEHLNSLKIKLEDGTFHSMVERRGRDISGKWIYLCYPCAAVCSGESILQTHISGKKHKVKLSLRSVWPKSIFEEHPYIMSEKGTLPKGGTTEKVLQKMAEEVDLHNKNPDELDLKYNKYREMRCHIHDIIETIKAPLLGLEYLVEHPPEQSHYEPSYICVLCSKQGHPRTIVNHMTCFWHRYNYLIRHYPKACVLLSPYRSQTKYREGVSVIMNRLAQRIEDKYGRLRPVNIDKEEYEKDKERIHQWIFKGFHFSEKDGATFEEVVDVDLITSLHKSNVENQTKTLSKIKDPSPPIVAAPIKPRGPSRVARRANSVEELSDISDDGAQKAQDHARDDRGSRQNRDRSDSRRARYEPYPDYSRGSSPFRSRFALKNTSSDLKSRTSDKEKRPANYDYKVKLADEKRKAAEESAKKTLAYHEKNPEKHPLYPEEWKKFWNRRYKEIQTEGKDPSKHDFKPEWIVFWTARMKDLHEEELRVNIMEIYRKLCLSPPDMSRRSQEPKKKSVERRRSIERHRSPGRRRSADVRRRSPFPRRRTPERRRSPEHRRRSPGIRRHSPLRRLRTRSRSPIPRGRSPTRAHVSSEAGRRSRSPLSRRGEDLRNRSPLAHRAQLGPSSQTVMISDDELKPDDGLSPWNSDNDLESLGSLPDARSPPVRTRSRTDSQASRASRPHHAPRDYHPRGAEPHDLGPAENVVATLRLLVALEDYLGSLGPKIVDLLTMALKMEKEKANSSEELLERESAVVLIETAKEKLKGAAQAGLVPASAAAATRAAVVRAASTLHEADTRAKRKQQLQQISNKEKVSGAAVPVAGVGEVDRAQIAQQMAAALIAQGKTDVSSEELAQLVDAVVGMAEAKKRESEIKKKVEARALAEKSSRPMITKSSTASALQMLQSAYDENDKRIEKEDVPDAMDGLSDSDLETLLKNFNELSAEEQHSLIAYLKKLEAREPQRVERLRQYVSAAAASAPSSTLQEEPALSPKEKDRPVTVESDDDDYTVEEVFQSATQKVKEDQIRQEMEIVKKTLEEFKSALPVGPEPAPAQAAVAKIDLTKSMSSATDLLALVQASIQSTSANQTPVIPVADVVTSNIQPRSFGDLPAQPVVPAEVPKQLLLTLTNMQNVNPVQTLKSSQNIPQQNNQSFGNQNYRQQPNQMNIGNRNYQNEPFNQSPWEQRDNINMMNNVPDNRGMNNMSDNRGMTNMSDNRGMNNMPDNRGMSNMPDNRGLSNMPDNRGLSNIPDNRGMNNIPENRDMNNMQDNRCMNNMQDSRGMNNMPDNRALINMPDNRGMNNMQDNRGMNNMQDNRGMNNMPDNRGMNNMVDNRGMNIMPDNRAVNNIQGPVPLMRGPGFDNFAQDSFSQGPPRGNFMNNRMQDNYDTRPLNQHQHFGNQGNRFRGRGGGRGMRGRGRGYY